MCPFSSLADFNPLQLTKSLKEKVSTITLTFLIAYKVLDI